MNTKRYIVIVCKLRVMLLFRRSAFNEPQRRARKRYASKLDPKSATSPPESARTRRQRASADLYGANYAAAIRQNASERNHRFIANRFVRECATTCVSRATDPYLVTSTPRTILHTITRGIGAAKSILRSMFR
ncbi:unnamed protein product, partial [Iphiclides podalirius]